jgi:hypothetical protein
MERYRFKRSLDKRSADKHLSASCRSIELHGCEESPRRFGYDREYDDRFGSPSSTKRLDEVGWNRINRCSGKHHIDKLLPARRPTIEAYARADARGQLSKDAESFDRLGQPACLECDSGKAFRD